MLHSDSIVALNIWYLLTIYIALISIGTIVDGTILSLQIAQPEQKRSSLKQKLLSLNLSCSINSASGGNDKQPPLGKSKPIVI